MTILHFLPHILPVFIDCFFADHEHVFLGKYLQILQMFIYNTMLHFFCICPPVVVEDAVLELQSRGRLVLGKGLV